MRCSRVGEAAGDADSSEGVQKNEKGTGKREEGDEGSSKPDGESLGVDLNEAYERLSTGAEVAVLKDIVRGRLHFGYFESEDGLFARGCGERVNEGGRTPKEVVGDEAVEGGVEGSGGELFPEGVLWDF